MTEVLCVGLSTLDVTYHGADLPQLGTKTQADTATIAVGGPAANAALAAAALNSTVTLCTALDEQPTGALAATQLRDGRVRVLRASAGGVVPLSSVIVDTRGERTVVSANGGGRKPQPPSDLESVAAESRIVLVDGHYPQLALVALTAARSAGVTTVIDLGSWKPTSPALLPWCDVAIASADFAAPYHDALDYLLEMGVSFAATSCGGAPIEWRRREGKTGTVTVVATETVNTNGAGDILHGAFAAFLAQGSDEVDALSAAAEVATASCLVEEARVPAEVVERFSGKFGSGQ